MGKKALFAAALAAGAAAVVSNAVLNDTLRRRPPNKDPLPDDEETRAATVWFKKYAKRVTYRNPENMRLTAWFIPHKGHRYAIICHGYGGRAECMRHRGKSFYDLGFNILMPNARAHGDSAGDWIGMGWPERKDIIGWIYEIIRRDKDAQILLYGESMGAATVMMTAGEQLPPQVKLAIEDCGYTSVWDQAKAAVKDLYAGAMGVFIPAVSLASKVKFGYSFREASALNQIRRCKIPVLFIHGEADALVPCAMVYRLYAAANCDKQLLTVPGAGHCLSASVAPKLYWSAVRSLSNVISTAENRAAPIGGAALFQAFERNENHGRKTKKGRGSGVFKAEYHV